MEKSESPSCSPWQGCNKWGWIKLTIQTIHFNFKRQLLLLSRGYQVADHPASLCDMPTSFPPAVAMSCFLNLQEATLF